MKIQHIAQDSVNQWTLQVAAENFNLAYLGSLISYDGGSKSEILRHAEIAWNFFTLLEENIWNSQIRMDTKVRLYKTYILSVLLYGCETWTVTKTSKAPQCFEHLVPVEELMHSIYQAHY